MAAVDSRTNPPMDNPPTIQDALRPLLDAQRARAEIFEPDDSYWYHRPQIDFPPKAIRDPGEYDGGERLSLTITQTELPAAKQKALVRDWCMRLPKLANVRTLWFHSKVTQEMFEAACAMPGLEGLYVKWSGIVSLAPLRGMATLRYFHLGGAPSATDLEALSSLAHLVDLEISNVRAAGDLGFLDGLPGLRALWLSGDSNSIKPLKIATLAPLAKLRELERLNLTTVQLDDESLAPLAALPKLRYLGLANKFPMEEFARLAGRRPDIACDRFVASWGPMDWTVCKGCKRKSMHLLTGKGRSMLCAHCDAARLAKHVAAFEAIVRASAIDRPGT